MPVPINGHAAEQDSDGRPLANQRSNLASQTNGHLASHSQANGFGQNGYALPPVSTNGSRHRVSYSTGHIRYNGRADYAPSHPAYMNGHTTEWNANGHAHSSHMNGNFEPFTNGHANGHANGFHNGASNGISHTNGHHVQYPSVHTNGNLNGGPYTNGHSNGISHTNGHAPAQHVNGNGHLPHANGHSSVPYQTSILPDLPAMAEPESPSLESVVSASESEGKFPIAIVGMACRLPGKVTDPEEFWELCSRARSGFSEMPKNRFNHAAFHHPNPDKIGCYNPKGGHFLDEDLALFDAPFFNLTKKEAIAMDPQQRLILECTYEALESGGIPKHKLAGQKVGVFVGGSFADYELNNIRDTDTAPMYQSTGNAPSLLANRVSYYFDFRGPSTTVETACSSSLTALHLACQSLKTGDCSQAIVASCHLNILPDYFITMSLQSLFSTDGRSYAFDHRANGYGRGEGSGCVVLKPLDQALKDNDAVRAVIVGSGMNQDGRTNGITMPSGDAQLELMKDVYGRAGLNPVETGYVEAHGTGTKAGDPIEANALHKMFGEGRTSRQPLYMGSVKSNVGHLEGASGIVSLIKTALMLEKGYVLPNHNFEKPNPSIPFTEWNFRVPKSLFPWPKGKKYASINSFGFGGANVHAVLEKAPPKIKPSFTEAKGSFGETKKLFVLSGNDVEAVTAQMNSLTVYLEHRPEVFQSNLMTNLAYTLGQRRSILAYKVAVSARSSSELIDALTAVGTKPTRSTTEPRIGFVFTGQGAQWHAMGRELQNVYPVYQSTIERCDRYLASLGSDFSLIHELSKDAETSRVSNADISQAACSAVQIAMVDLLRSWGITPHATTGHSSGEIASAYAAGALTLEAAMAIAFYRGQSVLRLKKRHPDLKGGMLAVGASPDEVLPLLATLKKGKAKIACFNSPSSITASGDEEAIAELAAKIEEKMMFNRKLRVDTAYHSHHMELVSQDYLQAIRHIIPLEGSGVAFHSSLFGKQVDLSALDASYWVANLVSSVRFTEAVTSMASPLDATTKAPGVDVMIEIGPHAALEGPVKQILKGMGGEATKVAYVSTLLRNKNAVDTSINTASQLFMKGFTKLNFELINFPITPQRTPEVLTDLPKYKWNHSTRFWHECRVSKQHRNREFARNDVVGTISSYSNELEPTWRNVIRPDEIPWVRQHKMQSMTVYPMAGYLAMAMEAAAQRATSRNITFDKFEFREITVSRPLVISEDIDAETNVTLRPFTEGLRKSSENWDEFRIFSWASDRGWIEHCRGLITLQKTPDANAVNGMQQSLEDKTSLMNEMKTVQNGCTTTVLHTEMYELLDTVGASYGPLFQGLENCRASDTHAVADLIVPDTAAVMPMGHEPELYMHPAFLDQFICSVWPILGAGRGCLDVLFMPRFCERLTISKSITRKSGDRLRVYARGNPNIQNPEPTKFTMFATPMDGTAEEFIRMEGVIMAPVFESADMSNLDPARELCYKTEWEPVPHHDQAASEAQSSPENVASGHKKSELQFSIICDETAQTTLSTSLSGLLSDFAQVAPTVSSLDETDHEGKVCIVLTELDRPILADLNEKDFQAIQKLASSAAGILWVVRGAYSDSSNPHLNMVSGMARSIRSETLLKFGTLDLDSKSQLSDMGVAQKILDVVQYMFTDESNSNPDMEFQERDGSLLVPRLVNDVEMSHVIDQAIRPSSKPDMQPFHQPGRPLKIAIETHGAFDTLHFVDDTIAETPLKDDEVSIEVRATSMNFKDIMIAMGEVSSKYIGVECSGVISGVGKNVTNVVVGDRVCAMSEGAYSNFARCLGTSVHKLPDTMSFEEGATIPVIFCTAYYSLYDIGRLTKGESVLIHAAAGGVGQAAIMLSQMTGAEIFATVGSVAKKTFLMNEYNIPEDHIFFSRDTSFAKSIQRATNGRGVDVVLNSLAGDQLRATWDSLAHFGRFVEIGKRDIVNNSRLDMARFEHNALFASVDLTVVASERPRIMARLLTDVFDLVGRGLAKPISPITTFSISAVEAAFRTLQGGKNTGKVVVTAGPHDQVKATPPKTPRQFLRGDATYIIVGGTGGIGRSMSKWMVEKGAKNIVLLSRSGLANGKVDGLIQEAASAGAKIVVRRCDVAKKADVDELVTKGLAAMPPIRGVVHSAMVLDDVLFEKMAYNQWDSVVKPKVAGAWNLHTALTGVELDFFVMLSSVAGAVGNQGQAAYAAANTFLDALALHRRAQGLPATSIDLPAVSEVGYLAENSSRQDQVAAQLGGETVGEAEIMALLAAAITGRMAGACNGHCVTGLKMPGDPDTLFWAADAKFTQLRAAAKAAQAQQANAAPVVSLRGALKAATAYDAALALVTDALLAKVAAVLMLPLKELDPSRQIVAYGLDSLVAIEIRNWITREMEANLQVLELLTSASFVALAASVLKKSKICGHLQAPAS